MKKNKPNQNNKAEAQSKSAGAKATPNGISKDKPTADAVKRSQRISNTQQKKDVKAKQQKEAEKKKASGQTAKGAENNKIVPVSNTEPNKTNAIL